MWKVYATITLLFLNTNLFGQNSFVLTVNVSNELGESINEGSAYLLNIKTDNLVKSQLIIEGQIKFESLLADEYKLMVLTENYEVSSQHINLSENQTIDLVISKKSEIDLDEVVVTKRRNVFNNVNGNLKVDVSNSIFKATPNTVDLLSKLPNIQISSGGRSITMLGKGTPLIYVDNQRMSLDDLNSLSVDDIKSIEIINNPSSKYEAAGRAVLLITRKLSRRKGFETNIAETSSFRKKFNNYLGLHTDFRMNRTEIKFNLNFNYLNPWESIENHFSIPEESINSNFLIESFTGRNQYILGTGVFHQINKDDYISFNVSGRKQDDESDNNTGTFYSQGNIQEEILTNTRTYENKSFFNSFFNYNNSLNSIDAELFTGFQYTTSIQKSDGIVQDNFNNTEYTLSQNRNQKFQVDVFSARLDFEKTFSNELKLEIGALMLNAQAKSNLDILNYLSPGEERSEYHFKEENFASYIQLLGDVGELGFSAGLRTENTIIKGKFLDQEEPEISKNYVNFFPKIQLETSMDSTSMLSVSYAKSIVRPNYSTTSQIAVYGNPYLVFSRNINLDPTITDEISANFQSEGNSIKLTYYQSKNPNYFVFSYDENDNTTKFSPFNFEKEVGIQLGLTIPLNYGFWSSTNEINASMVKIEDQLATVEKSKPFLYYYSSNSFKLPKDYAFLFTFWGLTTQNKGAIRNNPKFIFNASFSKKLFKNLEFTLSFNDLFKNMNFNDIITYDDVRSNAWIYTETHEISVNIRYKIGKIKDAMYKEKRVNDNFNRIR